ncbi:hypothetical protein [Albibacterium bauzanense]|uniref:DUF4328 domain-containing protein n=1 Tax=Albibacterium bauzanense TaxID=653929 RepID=A0A4R1LTU4_9SPHI|nr:hypothetical protein [Albibacterium bauzanense]TCK82746.1 hypothetical protein C8N28_1331 [Albibacterium bauzanense]
MEYNGITFTEDMIWALAITMVIYYTVLAFYCHTLKRTLDLIAEGNRFLKPKLAWLAMIPIFNIYWNFVIASRMSDSLTNEFYDRKIPEEEYPGKVTGTTYAILIALANFPVSQGLSVFTGLFSLYFFIRYWIKIDNFRVLLKEHNRYLMLQKESNEHETT